MNTDNTWKPGIEASQHLSLRWVIRKATRYNPNPQVHEAVMERTGFMTKCGLSYAYQETECYPLHPQWATPPKGLKAYKFCGRCWPFRDRKWRRVPWFGA